MCYLRLCISAVLRVRATRPRSSMRSFLKLCLTGVGAAVFLGSPVARAQEPTGASLPPASDANAEVTPPSLKVHPEATYPADALRDRIEGNVAIEVTVD